MKVVGLTGGIGSGKSTIARLFAALGIAVYDSDTEAKKLINTSAEIKKRIVEVFGAEAMLKGCITALIWLTLYFAIRISWRCLIV